MRTRHLVITTCALLALAGCSKSSSPTTTASPQSNTATVTGRITAADTGRPLADVSVSFVKPDGTAEGGAVSTDAEGRYSHSIAAGSYQVLVNSATEVKPLGWNGYPPVWTNGDLTGAKKATIAVATGQSTTYDLALPPVRNCPGTVRAASGSLPSSGGYISAAIFGSDAIFASLPIPPNGSFTFPLPDGDYQIIAGGPGLGQAVSSKVTVAGAPVTIPPLSIPPA